MKPILPKAGLLTIAILLIVSTSGCIDINFAKSLIEDEPLPPEYVNVHQWTLAHQFDSTIHEEDMPVHIKSDTLWLNFSIEVSMERSLGILRFAEVVIYKPGEHPGLFDEHYRRSFNTSAEDNVNIENPARGEWKFHIEGRGGSFGGISDGYHVEVWSYELDRR
jgi:hypothetical protein